MAVGLAARVSDAWPVQCGEVVAHQRSCAEERRCAHFEEAWEDSAD
ncbi:P-loop containing nucleoside triphosphate hydrolases superfamily protein [Actinidia rufa]|uniref:P-loop containing nucleoside triphosphate hydrolases superfamily protein n=1 Tax=Actinidia rufa TaxID=165716 RepID=A0A7J0D7L8_9ERIC|nr:P-loop containing nucleoside triphosphate hydrolases superfamily protein [Actinidia rufa]GFS43652.1 P-loop containing nucleoside triphosphate hydrolases superfamily protein [Actinidia rufa]